jgi:hypothetical protein
MRSKQIKKAIEAVRTERKISICERNRCCKNIRMMTSNEGDFVNVDVQGIAHAVKESAIEMQLFAKEVEIYSKVMSTLEGIK